VALSPDSDESTEVIDSLLVKPKFGGVAMVCGECQKRSNGPSKLKAKDVRKILKGELHHLPVRLRVVQCSCLGLCPKKAMAAAVVVASGRLLAAEMHSEAQARQAAADFSRSLR